MQPYPPVGPGQPGPYAYPYPPVPPSGPRTLGTLSIIFGAVVAAFSFFGAVGGAGMAGMMTNMMKGLPGNADFSGAMADYLHAIRTPSLIQGLVFVGMSIWLIVLGVGQRRYRAWAARQSMLWGVAALVILVGVTVMYLTVIGPAAERMMEAIARHSNAPSPFGSFMSFAGLGGVIVYAPYPIILIVTFRKPAIVSAMTA
ncbi:MAG TPA: hypothetical protein VF469_35680 [Kofleriaceae bacterium]